MKIDNQIVIRGETDFCTVTPQPDGRITVGSITVKDYAELAELGATLVKLSNMVPRPADHCPATATN